MRRSYLQHGRRHGPDGSDPIPGLSSSGQILQAYLGVGTASDFTWTTANTNTSSGYPSNNTFTKLEDDSYLLILANANMDSGSTVPNVYSMGLKIDGVIEENKFNDAAVANSIKAISWSKFSPNAYAAGAHTLDMFVWFLSAGGTWKIRTQAGVDLQILEVAV